MSEPISSEEMSAACETAFLLERAKLAARNLELPDDKTSRIAWAIGFSAGASWVLDKVREIK